VLSPPLSPFFFPSRYLFPLPPPHPEKEVTNMGPPCPSSFSFDRPRLGRRDSLYFFFPLFTFEFFLSPFLRRRQARVPFYWPLFPFRIFWPSGNISDAVSLFFPSLHIWPSSSMSKRSWIILFFPSSPPPSRNEPSRSIRGPSPFFFRDHFCFPPVRRG